VTLETPLSDAEIGELDAFLMSEATSDECMDIVTLDGFLTALVVGPQLLAPSVWLPVVWGGTSEPVFESKEQAERIIGLLLRRMNMITGMFGENSSGFEPLLYERETNGDRFWLADDWCLGFLRAMELGPEAWDPLFEDKTNRVLLEPILILGTQEGLDHIDATSDPESQYAATAAPASGIGRAAGARQLPVTRSKAGSGVAERIGQTALPAAPWRREACRPPSGAAGNTEDPEPDSNLVAAGLLV
jgi:uncharacterized protein